MDSKPNELELAQATRWYVRLRAADCTLAERRAYHAWLTQDPAHERAYSLARAAAGRVDTLTAADPRLQVLVAQALEAPAHAAKSAPPRWRAAAALVLGIGLAAVLALNHGAGDRRDVAAVASYSNAGMQLQVIELADGSRVHLDVGANLDVRMGKAERRLELHRGRAYFEVAHDATRPFSVQAVGSRTVALGTRFEVAVASQSVKVTLAEGSVAITPVAGFEGWREVLRPGQQLQMNDRGGRTKREIDAMSAVGWSHGRLVFKGAPLADVLEELNRYTSVKLQLEDASLGSLPIGGSFVAGGDTEQVVAALSAILPLRAVHVGASEIVLSRQYETAVN